MADIKSLAEKLVNLSVKDVNELANILKDEYSKSWSIFLKKISNKHFFEQTDF